MPLSVFDAVGRFTADTSELDRFIVSLERGLTTAEEKAAAAALKNKQAHEALRDAMKVVSIDGSDTADNMAKLAKAQQEAALAAQAASRAQRNLKADLGIVTNSTREARGEAALLGEAIGIHLPRHVQTFLAEMPGLSTALKGAFALTAVGFLIDALAQLPDKIIEITNKLAGWDKAAQDAYAAQIKLNDHLLEIAQQREEQQIRENERGLTGIQLTRQQLENDQKILDLDNQRIAGTGKQEGALRSQLELLKLQKDQLDQISAIPFGGSIVGFFTGDSQKIKELEKQIAELDAQTQKYHEATQKDDEQKKDRETELGQQSLEESIRFETAKIEAARKSADARYQITVAGAKLLYEQGKISYLQSIDLEQSANEAIYQNDEQALLRKLQQLKRDPTKNKDEIVSTNAEIEQLEAQHNAKILNDYATSLAEFKKITSDVLRQQKDAILSVVPQRTIIDSFKLLDSSLRSIGITSSVEIGHAAQVQQQEIGKIAQAYDELIAHAKSADDAQALSAEKTQVIAHAEREARIEEITQQIALLDLEITVANRKHLNATKEEADLKQLRQERQDLQRVEQKYGQTALQVSQAVAQGVLTQASAWASGQTTIVGALAGITAAVLNSIASIADKKGAEQLAEGFGSYPDFSAMTHHFTSATLWFALAGALSAGAGAAGSAGQKGSSASSGGAAEAAAPAVVQPPQNPIQVANAQHFAGGGLISSPTLAVIGDSIRGSGQREAAIPLDDPQAVEAIVEALGGGSGGDTHIHVRGLISADNLGKVVRKIDRSVKRGQARLTANNSFRLTRKT